MAASIVQAGNANSIPGGTFTNPFGSLVGASGVTAGNTILAIVGFAYDSAATTFTCTDTLLQTYTLVDYLSKSGDFNASLFICQNSASMPAPAAQTLTGSLSAGATSATLSSSWSGTTAKYIITFSSGEVRPVTLTNGSTAMSWGDGLGSTSTSSITVGYGPYFQAGNDGDFCVAAAVEIQGVPASGVLVAHNAAINSGIPVGSNNINPGPLACGTTSGLMVSFLLSVGNSGGSPTFAPKVGTSPVNFTQFGSGFWDFGFGGLGLLQYAHLTAPGTVTPTGGTQETAADEYFVWAVFLADATQPAVPAAYWRRSPGPGPGKFGRFYQSPKSYSVSTAVTATLTGQAGTFTAGTLSPATQVAATGQVATFAPGTVLPATQVALTGQSATFTAGTLLASSAIALAGRSAAFATGTLVPNTTVGLTGQVATFTAGTVTTGSDVTVSIAGQAAAFTAGVVAPSTSIALSGGANSFAAGNLLASLSAGLSGVSLPSSAGTLSPASSIPVLGLSVSFTAGILGVVGDVTVALTGAQASFNPGLISVDSGAQAGPVDSLRIAEGHYRRKKKRRHIEQPAEPVFIAPLERLPQALIERVPDFTTLAQTLGEKPSQLSARIESEIALLMQIADERDDEDAIAWILKGID